MVGLRFALASMLLVSALAPVSMAARCTSPSDCDFWDDYYHEYILYNIDTAKVDVLILPGATPFALRDIATAEAALQGWEDGVQALGAPWFRDAFELNYYTVGEDALIPPDALYDPEIIVVMAEANPAVLFGIGYQVPFSVCAERGGAAQTYPVHEHDGLRILAAECRTGGFTCVALNTNGLPWGARRMYNLVAHEVGHCLGTGHTGDAGDFHTKVFPAYDIMSYMHRESHVNCASNLNLRVMEGLYAQALGQPSSMWLRAGTFYTMAPSAYAQFGCAAGPSSVITEVPELPGVPVEPPQPPQDDDAGSGRDAPDSSSPDIVVAPGVAYEGRMLGTGVDYDDWYAFAGTAGQTVRMRVFGVVQCPGIYSGAGTSGGFVDTACAYDLDGSVVVTGTLTASGTSYLEIGTVQPALYRFGFGFGSAPDVSPAL